MPNTPARKTVARKTAVTPTAKPRVAVVEKKPESPVPRPPDQVKREAEVDTAPKEKVNVPNQFNFIDDDGGSHTIFPGVQMMLSSWIDHWWIKQQGVSRV